MTNTIIVACECGSLSAEAQLLKPESNTRIVCYCDDCQSYSRHLDSSGKLLDSNGGTDVIQLSPAHFKVARGREHLGVMRLSPNGLLRWYATCCNTPICNTPPNPGMPYLALLTRNFSRVKKSGKRQSDRLSTASIEDKIQAVFGPVSFGVGAGSQHPISAAWPVAKGFGFRGIFSTLKNIGRWRVRGDQKRSELLNAETGEPLKAPYILSIEERQAASKFNA